MSEQKQGNYKRRQWKKETPGRVGFITSSGSPVSNYGGKVGKWNRKRIKKRSQG